MSGRQAPDVSALQQAEHVLHQAALLALAQLPCGGLPGNHTQLRLQPR